MLQRAPRPSLRPFIKTLWAAPAPSEPRLTTASREHVLPTGDMHMVFRLAADPLTLFETVGATAGVNLGTAIVGGARATYYVREGAGPSWSVGAQLHPAAAQSLFGVPAAELAGRHTALDDLWGGAVEFLREQLYEVDDPATQLDRLECFLAARLPAVRGLHPAVAEALARLQTTPDVRAAVKATGYSHRRVIALFHQQMGLTPKVFCRLERFQRVLEDLTTHPTAAWADLALGAGYSDQSHLSREFREFAGLTPSAYRVVSPWSTHHVPVEVNFVQDTRTDRD